LSDAVGVKSMGRKRWGEACEGTATSLQRERVLSAEHAAASRLGVVQHGERLRITAARRVKRLAERAG